MNYSKNIFRQFIIMGVCCLSFCLNHAAAIPPDVNVVEVPTLHFATTSSNRTHQSPARLLSDMRRPEQVVGATGADTCAAALVTSVSVGLLGSPLTITINGDNTSATQADCTDLSTPVWWEAFEITECAKVTLDFCGTTPTRSPDNVTLSSSCPCGEFIGLSVIANRDLCGDGNVTLVYDQLPAGIYYYPIFSDGANFPDSIGPYQLNITAEECLGACCNLTDQSCTAGVGNSSCTLADEIFGAGQSCCELECRDPLDAFDASGVSLLSQIPLGDFSTNPAFSDDIWGYVSGSGREYAIMGLECAVGVVEVTDPENPVIIDEISGPCTIWRDIRTLGTFAYIVADNVDMGMQILDLSNVDSGVVTFVATVNPGGFQQAHNISVNEESGFAYVVSGTLSTGIAAIDLSNPTSPTVAGTWNTSNVHDVQVVSYTSGPFAGREIAFASAPTKGLRIVDVTNKGNMFTVSTVSYPNLAYAHQGWLSEDRRYFFLGDERDELNFGVPTTTYIIDVQDIENPFLLTTYTNNLCAIDHNMIVRSKHLYQANYSTGLRVIDISDPANMVEVGYFDTHPEDNITGFVGAWGVYPLLPSGNILISDIERGLFVLDVTDIIQSACCNLSNNTCENNVAHQDCQGVDQQWRMDQTCGEANCGVLVPTVSQWGLVWLTLLMMIGGTIVLKREKPAWRIT